MYLMRGKEFAEHDERTLRGREGTVRESETERECAYVCVCVCVCVCERQKV